MQTRFLVLAPLRPWTWHRPHPRLWRWQHDFHISGRRSDFVLLNFDETNSPGWEAALLVNYNSYTQWFHWFFWKLCRCSHQIMCPCWSLISGYSPKNAMTVRMLKDIIFHYISAIVSRSKWTNHVTNPCFTKISRTPTSKIVCGRLVTTSLESSKRQRLHNWVKAPGANLAVYSTEKGQGHVNQDVHFLGWLAGMVIPSF